ncbi:MAG: branched-chain amino acid ABC transporter permease [Pseudomonadota bacterium]
MNKLNFNGKTLACGLLLITLLGLPFSGIYTLFAIKALCFALFAAAFNLLLGQVGLLSFGHAAFFGLSAYVCGHAATSWGLPTEIAILFGTVVAAVLGLGIGWLAIRRQGIYFAMITLALAQMVYFFCLQAPFTGGEDGIQSIPRGNFIGLFSLESDTAMYYFVLGVFLLGVMALYRIIHSPFGAVLQAIRENEARAISLGYDVNRYKLTAFVLSAALTGLAGATKAVAMQIATLTDVHWHLSGEVILMSLFGGTATFAGPFFGGMSIVSLQNFFADKVGDWVTVIMGVIFVVCVMAFRQGVVGEFYEWLSRRKAVRLSVMTKKEFNS